MTIQETWLDLARIWNTFFQYAVTIAHSVVVCAVLIISDILRQAVKHMFSHDLDVRSSYSTLCKCQEVISCSGGPVGITIHDSGDIYVACSDKSIHVYDQGGHEKRTIGRGGSGDSHFSSPCGISIKGDVMYVAVIAFRS